MSNNQALDALTAIRSAAHLLERAALMVCACDNLSEEMRDDIQYHAGRNREFVELTAARLSYGIANGGDLE